MLLEVCLIGIEHTIEPGEKLVSTVVGVEYNRYAIGLGNGPDMLGGGNRTRDRRFLFAIGETLAGKVCRTTLGSLNDDWGLDIARRFEDGIGYRRRSNVLPKVNWSIKRSIAMGPAITYDGLSVPEKYGFSVACTRKNEIYLPLTGIAN